MASAHGKADLQAVRAAAPDAILLPKVESAADIAAAAGAIPIWAMIETPLGILNLAAIAASGAQCLAMGTNDLLNAMYAQPVPDRRNLWSALSQTVIAARAYGLSVIDGTYNEIGDDTGFAESCAQGRTFGFDGKTLIHPRQIETCNRIFAPSAEEISQAQRIIAAFAQNRQRRHRLDGRIVGACMPRSNAPAGAGAAIEPRLMLLTQYRGGGQRRTSPRCGAENAVYKLESTGAGAGGKTRLLAVPQSIEPPRGLTSGAMSGAARPC